MQTVGVDNNFLLFTTFTAWSHNSQAIVARVIGKKKNNLVSATTEPKIPLLDL